jgi:hypothetical protein
LSYFGRWWQLETWLREVVYVELRAKFGRAWTEQLGTRTPARVAQNGANAYMTSADHSDPLAYADVFDLLALSDEHWPLFAPVLLPKRRCDGAIDELRHLRHRNAHCRRPHHDDVRRVEQVLRDLEAGANRLYVSYLDASASYPDRDPVIRAWVGGRHEIAQRLLEHVERQYDVRFDLSYSVRPWANVGEVPQLSGTPGVLWHARWMCGARYVNVARLLGEISRPGLPRATLMHLLVYPSVITATFSATDDASVVANEIGYTFDDVLTSSSHDESLGGLAEERSQCTLAGIEQLPRRVQGNTPLAQLDPMEPGDSVFFA